MSHFLVRDITGLDGCEDTPSPNPRFSHRLLLLLSELAGAMPLVHSTEFFSHLLA